MPRRWLEKPFLPDQEKVEHIEVGDIVYFYRKYPNSKAVKLQAQRGCYLGPGVVIGMQAKNYWVSYASRCYLVAPEHIRSLAPDEVVGCKPLIRYGLEQLKLASQSNDFEDISQQQAEPQELEQASSRPPGGDFEVPQQDDGPAPVAPSTVPPQSPGQSLEPEPSEAQQLQDQVDEHIDETEEMAWDPLGQGLSLIHI